MTDRVTVTLNGEPVEGRQGQTIAGVLLGAGETSWRDAQTGGRGVFCGIGVCFDCVITVNGTENVRACQRTACNGDELTIEVRS
ncbi:(2Fe-2S)-binding protein [Microbacterium sp.]|uniref:(2Fe-2S)-binding protein n=1 Tax=Microbacterium sp. TaxID=51671 RepID=UPI003C77CC77